MPLASVYRNFIASWAGRTASAWTVAELAREIEREEATE